MTDETLPGEDSGEEKSNRLTEVQWAEIKEHYELGRKRLTELAEEYNVSRQALSRRFKANNIVFSSRQHELQQAVSNGIKQGVTTATGQAVAEAIERYAEKRMDWIEETRVAGYKSIKQAEMLAKKVIAEAIQNRRPLETANEDLKAVTRFQKILIDNAKARLEILRADEVVTEDDVPEIHFHDLTDEDILEHHRANGLFPDDADPDEVLAELNDYEIPE